MVLCEDVIAESGSNVTSLDSEKAICLYSHFFSSILLWTDALAGPSIAICTACFRCLVVITGNGNPEPGFHLTPAMWLILLRSYRLTFGSRP